MTTLNDRFQAGQNMRGLMSGGDQTHYALPGVDQLAPDLKRIIDEALFGLIWSRPGLDLKYRCIATVSALMALGELNLLRRHVDRSLNVGLTPQQVVEIFIQSTFYVGVPAVETALRLTKDIFEERGIDFRGVSEYDTNRHADELHALGQEIHRHHMGDLTTPGVNDDTPEAELERIVDEYHWGAIHSRSHLDDKARGYRLPGLPDGDGSIRCPDAAADSRRSGHWPVVHRGDGSVHSPLHVRRIHQHPHRHAHRTFGVRGVRHILKRRALGFHCTTREPEPPGINRQGGRW